MNQSRTSSRKMSDKEKSDGLRNSVLSSPIVNDIFFKALRLYPTTLPHPIPNVCINALNITESIEDLTKCVDEITFLKEQSVGVLKKHSMVIAFDLIQCGILSEQVILNLEDEQGRRIIKDEESADDTSDIHSDIVDDFKKEEEETEEEEGVGEQSSSFLDSTAGIEGEVDETKNELLLKYDSIRLAMARKLVDLIYQEVIKEKTGRFMWLEKICTALDLNGIDNVQPWLEKLTLAAKQTESVVMGPHLEWIIPESIGLNAPMEPRLTTSEIWQEIYTTLVDNLIVDNGVIDGLSKHHIINEQNKLNLLSLPHRKAKVKYLIKHMQEMGSTVMYMFGQVLEDNNQRHLGRIVVKRLDDNKVAYSVKSCE